MLITVLRSANSIFTMVTKQCVNDVMLIPHHIVQVHDFLTPVETYLQYLTPSTPEVEDILRSTLNLRAQDEPKIDIKTKMKLSIKRTEDMLKCEDIVLRFEAPHTPARTHVISFHLTFLHSD
jgi:hypothetical protein